MSTALVAFPAAPLDRTARMVTRGVWLLAVAGGVAGVVLAASGTTGAAAVLVGVAVVVALMMWSLSRLRPVEYLLEDGGFAVRRRNAPTKHFAGTTSKARRGHLGLRVAGDGGGYGYLGRYRAEGRTVRAFVTNREDVVLLDVGGVPLAISPDDPDVFLAEVERAA